MSVCENCKRETGSSLCYAGPFRFCSFLCRDTSEDLRNYEQMKAAEKRLIQVQGADFDVQTFGAPPEELNCGIGDGCQVCSGAMRERAGRGDRG